MARPKNLKGGRPPIEIDESILQKLTSLHLTTVTIARILSVSVDTLDRRYAEQMDKWRSETNSKIAAALFDEGINKREPWALKTLAQKHLDYSDKVNTEITGKDGKPIEITFTEMVKRVAASAK